MRGLVIGKPAASLKDAAWAVSEGAAKAGARAELATAATLDSLAARYPIAVLHDLRLPDSHANVDHVVVAGTRVMAVDSKAWKGGLYYTVANRTFRGWERFPVADKASQLHIRERLERIIPRHATQLTPLLSLHATGGEPIRRLHLRVPGARTVNAQGLERAVRFRIGTTPYDRAVVDALAKWVRP